MKVAPNAPTTETPARILLIDDDEAICGLVSKYLQHHGHTVDVHHDGTALEGALQSVYDVVLLDVSLPGSDGLTLLDRIGRERPELAVVMLTANVAAETVVDAMRRGAFDYMTKPLDMQRLRIVVRNASHHTRLRLESGGLRAAMIRGEGGPELICASQAMSEVIALVERVAGTNVPVLIHGEPGSGKGVVAWRIHARSRHRDGPFVQIACTASTAPALEGELFGTDGGIGKLRQAEGGTIYLDEVGELDMDLQTKLLRVLTETPPRARIVASTSRHLPSEVSRGKFRADLFYRLNVFSITVPPLRDRKDDIPALARYAAARFAARESKPPMKLADETIALLRGYDWPGNVRELNNAIERAALVSTEGEIKESDLPEEIRARATFPADDLEDDDEAVIYGEDGSAVRPLRDLEREMMVAALRETRGNVSEAARRLGIGRATFYRRAQRHGLTREDGFPG
jgi:DNA-binding NtrC family response regulator